MITRYEQYAYVGNYEVLIIFACNYDWLMNCTWNYNALLFQTNLIRRVQFFICFDEESIGFYLTLTMNVKRFHASKSRQYKDLILTWEGTFWLGLHKHKLNICKIKTGIRRHFSIQCERWEESVEQTLNNKNFGRFKFRTEFGLRVSNIFCVRNSKVSGISRDVIIC